MTVTTVYVVPLGDGKAEFTLVGKDKVKIVISDSSISMTATFPLSELMEIATNLEMDSVPEGEKKNG